jgi:hypothetical protein
VTDTANAVAQFDARDGSPTSRIMRSVAAVQFGPIQHLDFLNLELDFGFGSGNLLNFGLDPGSDPVRTCFFFPCTGYTQNSFQVLPSFIIIPVLRRRTQLNLLTMLNSTIC